MLRRELFVGIVKLRNDAETARPGERPIRYSKHYSLPNLGRVGSIQARNKIRKGKGVSDTKELLSMHKKNARRAHPEGILILFPPFFCRSLICGTLAGH